VARFAGKGFWLLPEESLDFCHQSEQMVLGPFTSGYAGELSRGIHVGAEFLGYSPEQNGAISG
jgi:hypothetical protein